MKFQTSTKEKSEGFEKVRLPEDIYVAELKEVKNITDGQYGPRVAWIYRIVDKGVDLALVCYKSKATKDNKLGQTLLAHGAKIDDNEVDVEQFYGSKVRVWVEDYEAKWTDSSGKEQKQMASTIAKVKPLAEAPAAPAAAA